ncbi:unnamed protein product [Moneuplotes crassus]|uniref:Uncharacterized protein n=1 Tax=Euplotes crassus TaxID=5936 RepID=A0AAD1YAU3_EUPCR|nr:unnamed protein product [Moneuplotes crassus]
MIVGSALCLILAILIGWGNDFLSPKKGVAVSTQISSLFMVIGANITVLALCLYLIINENRKGKQNYEPPIIMRADNTHAPEAR